MFGNVCLAFGTILENLWKVVRNLISMSINYNKKKITCWLEDMNFVLVTRTISHLFAGLTHEILFLPLEHKIHIFLPPCNVLYIFLIQILLTIKLIIKLTVTCDMRD